MPFSQKCAQIGNSWGPATELDICATYLLRLLNHKQSIGRKSLLHFVENGASTRHIQLLSEEDDEVLLSDCDMFCSARLLVGASGTLYMQAR